MYLREETILAMLEALGERGGTVADFAKAFWALIPPRKHSGLEKELPAAPRRRLGAAGRMLATLLTRGLAARWGGNAKRSRWSLTDAGRAELARLQRLARGDRTTEHKKAQ